MWLVCMSTTLLLCSRQFGDKFSSFRSGQMERPRCSAFILFTKQLFHPGRRETTSQTLCFIFGWTCQLRASQTFGYDISFPDAHLSTWFDMLQFGHHFQDTLCVCVTQIVWRAVGLSRTGKGRCCLQKWRAWKGSAFFGYTLATYFQSACCGPKTARES